MPIYKAQFGGIKFDQIEGYKISLAFTPNRGFEGNFYVYLWDYVDADKPFEDAEQFTPPPISVMDASKVNSEKEVTIEEKPVEFKYTGFDIVSPEKNQTIWNETELTVSVQLAPALNSAEGHNIWLLMDGEPVVKNSQSMSMQIGGVDRGAHQLQGQVRDKEGKIIVRTRAVVVYIQRTSVR